MQFLFHGEERDFYPYRQSCRHDRGGEARVPLSVRGFLRDVKKATALEKKNTFHSRMNFPVPKTHVLLRLGDAIL